jgi:hypothetical protein
MTTTLSTQPNKGRFLAHLQGSTPKQGDGVSLLTQREAIARFAVREHRNVIEWLEGKELPRSAAGQSSTPDILAASIAQSRASPQDGRRTPRHYDFVRAVVQRVAEAEQVMPGTALHLIIQDWILAVENHPYDPDVDSSLPLT